MRFVVNWIFVCSNNIYSRQQQISQSVFQRLPNYCTRVSVHKCVLSVTSDMSDMLDMSYSSSCLYVVTFYRSRKHACLIRSKSNLQTVTEMCGEPLWCN